MYRPFHHYIAIKHGIDVTAIQRDGLPVGQRYLAAVLIGAAPVPDAQERNAAQVLGYSGIRLTNPLSDKQWPSRICQP